MTKASPRRIAKKGKLATARRNFTPQEALELQEMNRVVFGRKFEAAQIAGNTALVPRGQEIAKELEAIARVLDNVRNQWIADKLLDCGYPEGTKCNINLSTGEVTLTPDEPANGK